jgi:hypothetical protein
MHRKYVNGQSQCVSPTHAGPQPPCISQEGTEGERIPSPRFLHDPVVLGQRLHYRAVAFRRDVISPGTAAPADDDPVTPAVGVACDACHGPWAKLKSRCHFSLVSKVNQTTPPQAAGIAFEKSFSDRSKLRGIRPVAIKKSRVVRRAKRNARETGALRASLLMQMLRRIIALSCKT